MQPTERYNSLNLTTRAVEVIGRRENPDDPVVPKVEGSRGTNLEQSIRRTGLVAEPLTREQRQAVQAAARDYGGTTDDRNWAVVCNRPRWHRGAHHWERFSLGTLTTQDPGPPDK